MIEPRGNVGLDRAGQVSAALDPPDVAAREPGAVRHAPAASSRASNSRVAADVREPVGSSDVPSMSPPMPMCSIPATARACSRCVDDVVDRRAAGTAARPSPRRGGRASRSCGSGPPRPWRPTAGSQSARGRRTNAARRSPCRRRRWRAAAASTSSGTLRGWSVTARQDECVNMTGAAWRPGRRAWSWPRRGRGRRASRSGSSPARPRGRTP